MPVAQRIGSKKGNGTCMGFDNQINASKGQLKQTVRNSLFVKK